MSLFGGFESLVRVSLIGVCDVVMTPSVIEMAVSNGVNGMVLAWVCFLLLLAGVVLCSGVYSQNLRRSQ